MEPGENAPKYEVKIWGRTDVVPTENGESAGQSGELPTLITLADEGSHAPQTTDKDQLPLAPRRRYCRTESPGRLINATGCKSPHRLECFPASFEQWQFGGALDEKTA